MRARWVRGGFERDCWPIMGQHDFLETTLQIPAMSLGVKSLLVQGVRRHGVADVAVALGLALSVGVSGAATVAGQGNASFEPRRPAPVAGRVAVDAPAKVTPPVSTAVQVPAPAHLPAAPHDLIAQPVTSPVAADGKELGRVSGAASTSVTAGGTRAGTAKPRVTREARHVVSRETTPLARGKVPRSGVAPGRHSNKGSPAEVHARKGPGRVTSTPAHPAVAQGAHPAERVRVASSGRTARHAAEPAKRLKASQTLARASTASTTPKARGLHRPSRTATASKAKQAPAARTVEATQVAQAAKAKKHGASLRSTKAASSSTAPAARRRGA